jgi:glycine dehydrogenase
VFGGQLRFADIASEARDASPPTSHARTACLKHPIFNRYRTETELLRYMRKLADRDLALDRAMIPLGSCTMKLNATSRDDPHHLARIRRAASVRARRAGAWLSRMFEDLKRWLVEITGYDAVSLQPNSGAQGEYAGLLAIRAYHHARGDQGIAPYA